jgi:hypothetical protein
MRKTTKVLSLGFEEWRNAVRQALPPWQRDGFWGVNNLWELCALPEAVSVDIAVFHHSFAQQDLRYSAEYIRRRWPDAVILVIGKQAGQLYDSLYDGKTSSEISIERLVSTIETPASARRRFGRNVQSGLGIAGG